MTSPRRKSKCESSARTDDGLNRLAQMLGVNHVNLTVPDSLKARKQNILTHPDLLSQEPRRRIVVVVGAGATEAAGLPGTNDAIEQIEQTMAPSLLKRELNRLHLEYQLKPTEFETVLLAASRFDRETVLRTLHHMLGRRYRPTLAHELLAHLLKHRFIDAIVNFNFDELLDQSVEDEIGRGHYLHIISDGDCPPDLNRAMKDGLRFHLPVYVKPHGTVSHKSTMRFTRGDYLLLPTDISHLLRKLLSDMPVTLVVIGFKMQSFEFNRIVTDCMVQPQCAIYNLTRELRPEPAPDQPILDLYNAGSYIPVTSCLSLDDRMRELWERVQAQFTESFQPRGIARHELVCSVFRHLRDQPDTNASLENLYLHDRAVLELALATAKAKGFVNTRVLSNGRAGRYFRLWKERSESSTTDPKTLFDLCISLGLVQCSYSREALRLAGCERVDAASSPAPRVMTEEEFKTEGMPTLRDATMSQMKRGWGQALTERTSMEPALLEMFARDEVEVVSAHPATRHELCADPVVLDTLTALKAYTVHSLDESTWDTLLCVAETGEWLIRKGVLELVRPRTWRLGLIVADNTQRQLIEDKCKNTEIDLKIRELSWWLHNQHMTLFVQESIVQKAIFFERRLRSPRIGPVIVEGKDAQPLLDVFFAYWLKAERAGSISAEDVANARRNFFALRERPTRAAMRMLLLPYRAMKRCVRHRSLRG